MSITHINLDPLKLKVALAKKKISQFELSQKSGCNNRYFNHDPIRVTLRSAGAIAEVLQADLEELLDSNQEEGK